MPTNTASATAAAQESSCLAIPRCPSFSRAEQTQTAAGPLAYDFRPDERVVFEGFAKMASAVGFNQGAGPQLETNDEREGGATQRNADDPERQVQRLAVAPD